MSEIRTHNIIVDLGTDWTGICKSKIPCTTTATMASGINDENMSSHTVFYRFRSSDVKMSDVELGKGS